jgi:hypothetical protein
MTAPNYKEFHENLRKDLMLIQMRIVLQQRALGLLEIRAIDELKKLNTPKLETVA